MTLSDIEQSIKRALSVAEIDAIERVKVHLPVDRRKAKRLLRQARERARKAELASMKRAGKIREPTDEELHLALDSLSRWQSPAEFIDRVEGEDPPDAWLRFEDAQDEPVEITEVQEPNRRRGDEYRRGGAAAAVFVPYSQVAARAQSVSSEIKKAIDTKDGKYDFKPHLLIYLNFPYGRAESQVQAAIADMRTKYADSFREIHIVTDTKLL